MKKIVFLSLILTTVVIAGCHSSGTIKREDGTYEVRTEVYRGFKRWAFDVHETSDLTSQTKAESICTNQGKEVLEKDSFYKKAPNGKTYHTFIFKCI